MYLWPLFLARPFRLEIFFCFASGLQIGNAKGEIATEMRENGGTKTFGTNSVQRSVPKIKYKNCFAKLFSLLAKQPKKNESLPKLF